MKILILTGKFGMGHWSASQSLRLQLLAEDPNAEIEVEDFLAYAMPDVSEAMYKGFSLLVTHGSGIFNTYYKMTENMENEARPPFERLFLEKLEELLAKQSPDMVIATHPLCAQLVSRHKWETGSSLPLVTCITDLSVHSEWITGGTDCYLVGAGEMTQRLARKGVDPAKVIVTGIPVKPEFEATPRHRGGETRSLLIMGGGLGLMPKKDKFYEALNALPNLRTTIIAGSNKHLAERLAGKYENIQVVGYTDHVADYMANADLMLSKPG
ncbi:MAG: UDP-diphospho-muramoylpentapeptide beta-N-acetylglucosaminyltransferase, partial [Pseudoflavonifractor sp.]